MREKRHKNETKNVNKNSLLLFNFCNIFDHLTTRTEAVVTPYFWTSFLHIFL